MNVRAMIYKQSALLTGFFIFLLALILRFWDLGVLPGPVLDEIYFREYPFGYLSGRTFFHVHPPLANYFFTASIWIYYHLPWVEAVDFASMPIDQLKEVSYRWLNALIGSLLSPLLAITLYTLTRNKSFALIGAFFMAIDGALLIDSRVVMNNIYISFFGLLAFYSVAKAHALHSEAGQRAPRTLNNYTLMAACGLFLGCGLAVKWNSIGWLMPLVAFYLGLLVVRWFDQSRSAQGVTNSLVFQWAVAPKSYLLFLIVLPIIAYSIMWIPDRLYDPNYGFIEMHKQIFYYHADTVKGDVHPYCSKWYSWPLAIRPMSYYFNVGTVIDELGNQIKQYRAVTSLPNLAITWLSVAAIVAMIIQWLQLFWLWFKTGAVSRQWAIYSLILLAYFANLLPWAFVSRCMFIYHYQSAGVFGFIALAWYISQGLRSSNQWFKSAGYLAMLLIVVAFFYWLPIWLGLPIDGETYYNRMWFRSWI